MIEVVDSEAPSDGGTSAATYELTAPMGKSGKEALIEFDELEPGTRVGRYVILQALGEGGMSRVYLAEDPELDRRVAIKILRAVSTDPERANRTSARLLREAQAIARLSHPNVVSVFDVGRHVQGVFIAMEYVDGQSLRAWVDARPHSLHEILDVFIGVARGLEAAHEAAVIHRDVKPENIIVDDRGRVKVLDFGLARASLVEDPATGESSESGPKSDSLLSESMTVQGQVLGTPAYMSPEQSRGEVAAGATDQFSLCVALFEATVGTRPFQGNTILALNRARARGPAFPQGVAVRADLRRLLERGLNQKPQDRFASMTELVEALEAIRFRQRRLLTRLAIGAGVVITAGGLWALGTDRHDLCADSAAFEAWGTPQRQALRDVFDANPGGGGQDAWSRVSQTLDRYAAAWSKARLDVCTDAAKGVASGEEMDLRHACLDRQRQAFESLLDAIAEGGVEGVARSPSLVAELPPVSECADIDALRLLPPEPSDPQLRLRVSDARADLADALALRRAGRFEEARIRLDQLEPRVQDLGSPAVEAELQLERARLRGAVSDFDGAEESLRQALRLAEAARYPTLRAEVYIALVGILGGGLKRFEAAREASANATAAIEGLGRPPRLVARLRFAEGGLLEARDRTAQALDKYEEVLEMKGSEIPRDDVLERIAATTRTDNELRLARFEDLLQMRLDLFGPNHPGVADALIGIAVSHIRTRDLDEAEKRLDEAMKIRKRVFGPTSMPVAEIESQLGVVAIHREDYDVALDHLTRALHISHSDPGRPDFDVSNVRSNLAIVYSRRGEQKLAREMHLESLETIARADPEHPRRVIPMINIAMTYQREERWDEAVEWLQKAETLLASQPDGRSRAGDMARQIADIRWGEGDLERAYDAYLRALAYYEAEPRGYRTASMHLALGRIRLEQGDPKAAEGRFMAASADIELMPEGERWGVRGSLELELAKLAWDHHHDHAGAREHAQRALEYVRRVDPEYRAELETAVETWLAEH